MRGQLLWCLRISLRIAESPYKQLRNFANSRHCLRRMRYRKEKRRGRKRARSAGFVFELNLGHGRFLCCGDKLIDYGRELWTGCYYECAFLPVVKAAAAAGTRALVWFLYDYWPGGRVFCFLFFTWPVLTYNFRAIREVHCKTAYVVVRHSSNHDRMNQSQQCRPPYQSRTSILQLIRPAVAQSTP